MIQDRAIVTANANRNPYEIYRMILFPMTFSDLLSYFLRSGYSSASYTSIVVQTGYNLSTNAIFSDLE